MLNLNQNKKTVVLIAGLLAVSMTLSSCDTLRRKFTRHKKHGEEEQSFIPVLEPEEYPAPEFNPQLNYKEQYDLIKAWYNDLWSALHDKSSEKYLHYIIREVTDHITKMQKYVDAPTQADLVKLSGFLDYYRSSLDDPWPSRNVSRIESDLRAFDRFLRNHLRADKIKGHFVKPK
ncbi:MAG: hypothetical protein HQL14_06270 [Candidatus Omnitrophica bacterium]|nr:hypothetical protein [Candidatus Omnitrophota bacterium]